LAFFAPAFLADDFFALEFEAFMALAGFFFALAFFPAVLVPFAFIAIAVLLDVAASRRTGCREFLDPAFAVEYC
jgi:hypothetical protein